MPAGHSEKTLGAKVGGRKAWVAPKLTAMPSELAETNNASHAIDRLYPAANGTS